MTDRILTKLQESSNNKQAELRFLTAQMMIKKLLSCDRVVKIEVRRRKYIAQELADRLSISPTELETFTKQPTKRLNKTAGKISLQLIKLYCNTKWADL